MLLHKYLCRSLHSNLTFGKLRSCVLFKNCENDFEYYFMYVTIICYVLLVTSDRLTPSQLHPTDWFLSESHLSNWDLYQPHHGQLRLFRGTSDWQSISRVTSDRRVSPFINSTHLTLQYRTRDQDGNCNVKKRLFTLKQWSLDVNRNWQLLFWSHCHSSPSVGARSWSSRCRCIWGENRDQELTIVRFDVGNKGLLRTIQKEEPTTRTSPRR